MRENLKYRIDSFLRKVKLRPDTVAGKCRLQFGLALVLILALALLIPYYWMDKLAEKSPLDTGSAITELLLSGHIYNHDKLGRESSIGIISENEELGPLNPDSQRRVRWVRIKEDDPQLLAQLSQEQYEVLDMLKSDEAPSGYSWMEKKDGKPFRYYMQLVRAQDRCLRCHNSQGMAVPFNAGQEVGAVIYKTMDVNTENTRLMNQLFIVFAGLLAGLGAIIAVYVIIQRIILHPIRQLRALVNNISDGQMDARAAIKTGDEYQSLSGAFNDMLDGLEESQTKLRDANTQLDSKIVELSERNIELFKANKLKSEFLANMSHEFRTPLNAILGFADILKEKPGEDVDKSRRYADNIVRSGRSLLNMINDLLDLAKAEAGKLKLHISKTSIDELCNSLSIFFSPITEKQLIKVKVRIEEEIPIIETDAGKVQQILYNFFSNATKFTPEGGKILISAHMLDEKTIRISVSDTGCGIPEDQLGSIFEKFRQIDGSITRNGAGTGLGLAISTELANLLAANVSVESKFGEGSTFHLDLPIMSPQQVDNIKKAQDSDEEQD